MPIAFIGIGSNIEPRLKYIFDALEKTKKITEILKISSIYETQPWGNPNLNPFFNAVMKIQTSLTPYQLLENLLKIERELGRKRTTKWDNRTIDLDLLDYENIVLNDTQLILPHPFLHQREFVIVPWFEIQPGWVLANNLKIDDLFNQIDKTTLQKKVFEINLNFL
jgi:2-amino-4-hydroxy-6-hydroxymethyldihydropteridine diphosphokinase